MIYEWSKKKESIKRIMRSVDVKVISFDIFDTLLVRSTLNPENIFRIVCDKINNEFHVDVYQERLCAETKIHAENVTIADIWHYIGNKFSLQDRSIDRCIEIEINTELDYLHPRYYGYELYEYACSLNKKIIAISDMYIPGGILRSFLKKYGYDKFTNLYVSCDCQCRKDSGELYRYVADAENIKGYSEILHIGDNIFSDFRLPRRMGIKACYLPSNMNLLNSYLTSDGVKILQTLSQDAYISTIMGFAVNSLFESKGDVGCGRRLSRSQFGKLLLFPLLTEIILFIYNNEAIREQFKDIYFISRDGFLPSKAYEHLKEIKCNENMPIPHYFYGSRIAFSCLDEDEDSPRRKALLNYYTKNVFCGKEKRHIIFDCGYSGSVSLNFGRIFDEKKYFDKIYLWETEKNQLLDKVQGTRTFLAIGSEKPGWLDVVIENCFSPLQGCCIGFEEHKGIAEPLFEDMEISACMRDDLQEIQDACMANYDKFIDKFTAYLSYYRIKDNSGIVALFDYLFTKDKKNDAMFDNILFPGTSATCESVSLGAIIRDIRGDFKWRKRIQRTLCRMKKYIRRS